MDENEAKVISILAKPVIESLIQSFLKPKIQQILNWNKNEEAQYQEEYIKKVEQNFEEYLLRTYKRSKSINVLVFPNQQIDIEDIYIPLTVVSTKNHEKITINSFKPELLTPYNKILLADTAGMGKSTLLKYLAIKIIETNSGIPILIDLRNLNENNLIIQEIKSQLNPIFSIFDDDTIFNLIKTGVIIFLFDGFDEIQEKKRDAIIKDIRQFIDKAHESWYILTSRPEPSLAAFGDFQQFNIQPLKNDEAFKLISKYDNIKKFGIASQLISDIKLKLNQIISFLSNPFLVSLLYKTYTYTKDIPASKVTFYDEVYSALFKYHDLSKEGWQRSKKSRLEIQQFRFILRQLAFDTIKVNLVSYSKQEAIQRIKSAKEKCLGIEFREEDFLDDLLSAVPLFSDDGLKVKWAHKSFQDFFASEYLSLSNNKTEKLNQIYKNRKANYLNVLDFFYELDYKTFRQTIIWSLLNDFLESYDKIYTDLPNISVASIKKRKSTVPFNPSIYLYQRANPENNALQTLREKEIKEGKTGNLIGVIYSTGLGITYESDIRNQLLAMLGARKVNFLKKSLGHDFSTLKELSEQPIKLTDDKNIWPNSPDTFDQVTSILMDTHMNSYIFDEEVARELFSKIATEIALENIDADDI